MLAKAELQAELVLDCIAPKLDRSSEMLITDLVKLRPSLSDEFAKLKMNGDVRTFSEVIDRDQSI